MAAGDLTIKGSTGLAVLGRRVVFGEVQLDGSNPTPVDLSGHLSSVDNAVITLKGTAAPGDNASVFSAGFSGATLNVYAWAGNGTDPTLAASTDATSVVCFMAVGPSK